LTKKKKSYNAVDRKFTSGHRERLEPRELFVLDEPNREDRLEIVFKKKNLKDKSFSEEGSEAFARRLNCLKL